MCNTYFNLQHIKETFKQLLHINTQNKILDFYKILFDLYVDFIYLQDVEIKHMVENDKRRVSGLA